MGVGENVMTGTSGKTAESLDVTQAPAQPAGAALVTSPLLLEGWLEFNRLVHDVEPIRLRAGGNGTDAATLDAVLYLNKQGRVVRPWRNPYIPIAFHGTPTIYQYRNELHWLEQADEVVGEMRRRGVRNEIHFTPNVQDIRPWQWAGFNAGVRYTYMIDLPFDVTKVSKKVRARVRRGEKQGFRVERTNDWDAVYDCLRASEARQGYRIGLTLQDMKLARDLLGEDVLLGYIAYAPNGDPASSAINLHTPGATGIGWVGGTKDEHLSTGAADMVELFSYQDMERSGARGIDLTGANLRTISHYKASLGARLVPYYSIESYSPRRLGKWMKSWWEFHRAREA